MVINHIKENYGFKDWDEKALNKLAPIMDQHGDDFIEAFYIKVMKFKNATKYLKDEHVVKKHKSNLSRGLKIHPWTFFFDGLVLSRSVIRKALHNFDRQAIKFHDICVALQIRRFGRVEFLTKCLRIVK